MVKKLFWFGVLIYMLYAASMWVYLFYGPEIELPHTLKGSVADPATFMTERELALSYEYSRLKHFIFFIRTPFEWLTIAAIIIFPISQKLQQWSKKITRVKFLEVLIYIFCFVLILFLANLPLKWISYQISLSYGVSVAPFSLWMKDRLTGFLLNYLMLAAIGGWLVWILKKARWWFYSWLLFIPLTFFFVFLQPIVIDPLYNEFSTLKNKELETSILALADKAQIPAEHVYEIKMSTKTNALNAYVNGIGANARIVLWDTTLEELEEQSILFIMAHEMAHYVYKHVLLGVLSYLLGALFLLWIVAKVLEGINRRFGEVLSLRENLLAQLPVVLLLFSMITFSANPVSNMVSREMERAADSYAIELTEDKEAAVDAFQALTVKGLSEVQPPRLVYWFRYGHPSMLERLQSLIQVDGEE